jgi:Ca2+-binding RTX toxin-like protein
MKMSITPWSPVINVAATGGFEFLSNSIQLVDGTIIVAYGKYNPAFSSYEINFQRFSDTGLALGAPILSGLLAQLFFTSSSTNGFSPHLAALTDGGFAMTWFTGNVVVQEFTAAGVALGTATTLEASSQFGDIAAMPGGEFVVAFGDKIQIFQQNGMPYSAISLGNSSITDRDVAVNASRIAVISDNNGASVRIESFDLNGNNRILGSAGSGGATSIGANAISTLSTGGFVGVFERESPSGGPAGPRAIYVMTTSPDGNTVLYGDTMLVNGLKNVISLDVKGLANGGFAITYTASVSGATDQYDTYVKAFNADGSSTGGEFVLQRTDPALGAVFPELTSLSDGRLLITWTEQNNGFTVSDTKMQILDPRDGYYVGTAGIDKIYGHDGRVDEIHGQAGNDTIYGLAGADILYGEAGTDFLYGGRGDDTTHGGADTDYMYGDLGDDEQYGEAGNDLMYSGRGADLLDGGTGSDTAYYTSEKIGAVINLLNQLLNAGSADGDTFVSVERFFGSEAAADNITGDNVSNTILGNGGADIINGAGGADVLRGGTGADTIDGGTESDLFQYTALNEVGDTIVNFEAIDNFQFTRAAFGNLAGANVAAVNFLSVASGHVATTAAHRFIFDQALDQLWYDADGNAAGAAVMVADLSNNINITNLDLLLM